MSKKTGCNTRKTRKLKPLQATGNPLQHKIILEKEETQKAINCGFLTREAPAVLVSLQSQFGEKPRPRQTIVLIAPTPTDHRRNGAVLNKLMATKFPTFAVLMEPATNMKKDETTDGAPRDGNREAGPRGQRTVRILQPDAQNPGQLREPGLGRTSSSTRVPANQRDAYDRRPEERFRVADPW